MEELFGYVSQEDVTVSQSSKWKWGVNFDVRLKNIEYHEATKNKDDKEVSPKVVITFGFADDTDEKNYKKLTVFEPDKTKQYVDGKLVSETDNQEEVYKQYTKQVKKATRSILDIAECFIEPQKLETAIRNAQSTAVAKKAVFGFREFSNLIIKGIKSKDFENIPLDLFLQYSSKLSTSGNSYLEIPGAGQGHYVTKHKEGEWQEEKVDKKYYKLFKLENGVKTKEEHPISRGDFEYFWKHNVEKISVKDNKKDVDEFNDETPSSSGDDWDI